MPCDVLSFRCVFPRCRSVFFFFFATSASTSFPLWGVCLPFGLLNVYAQSSFLVCVCVQRKTMKG